MHSLSIAGVSFPLIPFLFLSSIALVGLLNQVLNRLFPGPVVGLTDAFINCTLVALLISRVVFVALHWSDFNSAWQWFDIRDRGFHASTFVTTFVVGLVHYGWRSRSAVKRLAWILPLALVWMGGGYALLKAMNPVPEHWPDERFVSLDGESVGFTDTEYPLTVVNLWASWCPSCRTEMPALEQAQGDYPDIRFILLNQGESAAEVKRYLTEGGYRFDNVWLDRQGTMAAWLGQSALPVTLVFNPQGKLINGHMGILSKAVLAELIQKTGQ